MSQPQITMHLRDAAHPADCRGCGDVGTPTNATDRLDPVATLDAHLRRVADQFTADRIAGRVDQGRLFTLAADLDELHGAVMAAHDAWASPSP